MIGVWASNCWVDAYVWRWEEGREMLQVVGIMEGGRCKFE